ncbi:MAG TPA: hypothetical protein VNZ26_28335 [Vicinamibacterales bacterium]|nr:hypothetical protein [Vicinamibacterales bacterium]
MTNRRTFIKRMIGAGLTVGAANRVRELEAQSRPNPPQNLRIVADAGTGASASGSVLQTSDLSYAGYYDLARGLGGTLPEWGQGFTFRYVNGQLRFFTCGLMNGGLCLIEFAAPSALGGLVTDVTGSWSSIADGGNHLGLWWEEAHQRLWATVAPDYPDNAGTVDVHAITTRTLNPDGTYSDVHGPVGLTGVGTRAIYGGAQPVPSWFQQQYGVGPYVVGFGGYTSRMAQGLACSMGPSCFAMPDPASIADQTSNFKSLLDYRSGTTTLDWYAQGHPTTFDRGVRNSDVINYYDNGDPRQNPSTPPTVPPAASAQWVSPAPDGLGRFIWGDSFNNTGCWIDTPNKRGLLLVASLGSGNAYYMSSQGYTDRKSFEVQIFDPADLGKAAQRRVSPWLVRPASRQVITLPGLGGPNNSGIAPAGGVGGAAYDPMTKLLYLYGVWMNDTIQNRIYVYQVNA